MPEASAPAATTPSSPAPAPSSSSGTSAPSQPQNLTPAGSNAPDKSTPPTPQEVKNQVERRKYNLKVDGKEHPLELTDDEISVRLQKALAAERRMQEAAEERKKLAQALEYFKKDPFTAAKQFDLDLDQLAEERFAKRLQRETMDPQARAVAEMQERAEKAERDLKEFQSREQQRAQAEFEQKTFKQVESQFIAALKQEGVEPSFQSLAQMAEIAKQGLTYGIEYTVPQLAQEVKNRVTEARTTLAKQASTNLKGAQLLQYLGDDIVNEIIRTKVEQVRGTQAPPVEAPRTKTRSQEPEHKDPFEERIARQSRSMMEWQKMRRGG